MPAQLIALFGAGVASFLAPCIVPLLPAYLGIIVGESADARDPARAVPATLVFVAGLRHRVRRVRRGGRRYSVRRCTTSRTGSSASVACSSRIMGLALLGVIRGPFVRERRLVPRLPGASMGSFRPFVVGVAFGAAWSPCVGPLLAAALTVAARSGQAGRGAVLLLAYAFGIGVPFLLAALGLASSPAIAERLRRAGPTIERVAGVLLLVLGVLLATGTYSHLTSYLARFTPAIGGL